MASRVSAFAMYSQNPSKESSDGSEAAKPNKKRPKKIIDTNNADSALKKKKRGRPKGEPHVMRKRRNIVKPVRFAVEAETVSESEQIENNKEEIIESVEEDDSSDSQNGLVADVEETKPTPAKKATTSPGKKPKVSLCGNAAADDAMKWILAPIATDHFFTTVFEKKPYYISRKNPTHFDGLFTLKDFEKMVKENQLSYGVHIDIVSYIKGNRVPVDNGMIALPDFIWSEYLDGNSIRMRNPQAYNQHIWQLCSLLQEFFSSCVGCNMYLTPDNSQGFPPHWDDIDAFILQIEGKKTWQIYKPKEGEEFPKYSSGDLNEADLGELIMEQEVQAGDTLYIPRGYVHQAKATNDHSLHLTFSTNQMNTWSDLIKLGLEAAMKKATEENVELRRSLPKDYLEFAGATYSEEDDGNLHRWAFRNTVKELVNQVVSHFDVDQATDLHAKEFINGCVPPCFNKNEGMCSIHMNGLRYRNGRIVKVALLSGECKVRLIRKRGFRLVLEDKPRLYHTVGNSKNSKEFEPSFLELEEYHIPALCTLFQKYPEYMLVNDLPSSNEDPEMVLADVLYYNGFLETEVPLPPMEEE